MEPACPIRQNLWPQGAPHLRGPLRPAACHPIPPPLMLPPSASYLATHLPPPPPASFGRYMPLPPTSFFRARGHKTTSCRGPKKLWASPGSACSRQARKSQEGICLYWDHFFFFLIICVELLNRVNELTAHYLKISAIWHGILFKKDWQWHNLPDCISHCSYCHSQSILIPQSLHTRKENKEEINIPYTLNLMRAVIIPSIQKGSSQLLPNGV